MSESMAQPVRRRRWSGDEKRACLQRQAASGLAISDFRHQEKLACSTFHQWRRTLVNTSAATSASNTDGSRSTTTTADFIEVKLAPTHPDPHTSAPLHLVLPSGTCLDTNTDCPPAWLAALLRALDAPC